MRPKGAPLSRTLAVVMGVIILAGCGSGSINNTLTTLTTSVPVANSVPVLVNAGPANNALNAAYVSVQVCNPGGTTNCATIPDVLVDTGSSGLRILASAPGVSNLALTQVTGSGTPVYECYQYANGSYLWGQVEQADVSMAGENATTVPIQVIASSNAPANVPSTCASGGGNNLGSSMTLLANGILGIGPALQDCGILCTGSPVLPYYWLCASTSSVCTTNAAVPVATQVSNPVAFFNSDNNGVMLTMNSLGSTSEATSASGTLYFGIGTQADNALNSSAKAYALSLNTLNGLEYNSIYTAYNGVAYRAYVDSSESILFLLDAATLAGTGISNCPNTFLYCTTSAVSLPFMVKDTNSDSASVTLSIGNGTTLYNSSVAVAGGSNTAFSTLAGGAALANDEVILGMPFFYGRTVYVGIAGEVPPSGVPASFAGLGYWAF